MDVGGTKINEITWPKRGVILDMPVSSTESTLWTILDPMPHMIPRNLMLRLETSARTVAGLAPTLSCIPGTELNLRLPR